MSGPDETNDVERLQRELDELKRRNEELEHQIEPHSHHLGRRIGAIILIVLAGVLAPISTMGLWLRSQVTDTDKYVRTVQPLVSDPAIQNFVADRVTQRLFEEVDVQTAIQDALPERAAFLSGALTSGLQTLVREATLRVVESDQFAQLWTSANRLAHEQMVAVLTGKSSNVISTKDGVVSLDLSGIANEVVSQLKSRGVDLFDSVNLQPGRFTVEIFQSDAITRVQLAFSAFNTVAVVLPFLTILLFIGGILLFPEPSARGAVGCGGVEPRHGGAAARVGDRSHRLSRRHSVVGHAPGRGLDVLRHARAVPAPERACAAGRRHHRCTRVHHPRPGLGRTPIPRLGGATARPGRRRGV